jgi:peptide/nickel transport system substrate-binding protein
VLDAILLMSLPDTAVRVQALRSGEADLAIVDIDDTDFLMARGFEIAHASAMQVMSLAFNTERDPPSPVDDVRVRRALNYAVDRQALADILLRGLAKPAGQPASRVTTGYAPDVEPYPYDPAKARSLLAEAGYPDGFAVEIQVAEGNVPGAMQIYQMITQYFRAVGVEATVQVRPFPAWLRDYLAGTVSSAMFGLPWNAAPYNDVVRPMEYYSCLKRNPFFCEPSVVPMIEAANVETDPTRRLALLRELAATLHDLAPSVFLVEQIDLFALSPAIEHLEIANRVPVYERIRMSGDR